MSKKHSKDLFDDTTMTFGEHLEELRVRLWRAIIGLTIGTVVTMYYGDYVMAVVRKPIEDALRTRAMGKTVADEIAKTFDVSKFWDRLLGRAPPPEPEPESAPSIGGTEDAETIKIELRPSELLSALHKVDPERFAAPEKKPEPAATDDAAKPQANTAAAEPAEKPISLHVRAPQFAQFQKAFEMQQKPIVLTVQEAFMTWLKVSFVAGLVLSSPWVFFQMWLFVAAGLYPHERKYVYIYLPMSLGLFLGGAVFCFFCVFPFVLDFLLGFSIAIDVQPQIRLADWINFAILLPVMFGISFQLPLVMLFLERISIFAVKDYREKRRIAIFVITVLSMLLTPAEPYSMIMMMVPLIVLYEFGIVICQWFPRPKPFDDEDEQEKKTAVATT